MQKYAKRETTMAFKKTMATKRDEQKWPHNHKGSLKTRHTPQNKTERTPERDTHHTNIVTGATPPPPSRPEHPEGLPIPPCLWKTLWITPVTQITM